MRGEDCPGGSEDGLTHISVEWNEGMARGPRVKGLNEGATRVVLLGIVADGFAESTTQWLVGKVAPTWRGENVG